MKKKIYSLFTFFLLIGLGACSEDKEVLDASASLPQIKFAYDELSADMNVIDNLPVVAVIKSELGLKKVELRILEGAQAIDYKTISTFFNPKSYSLAEKINYKETYTGFVVEVTDKLDRTVIDTLNLNVIEVKEAPQIVFDPAEIVYDELVGGEMPMTHYSVTASAALKSLEMFLVSESGQIQYGFPIDFTNGETEYTFNEKILYQEGDKGFKVKVTDAYGQVKIETLPVKYLTPKPPTVVLKEDTIYAEKDELVKVRMQLSSQRGIAKVDIYRIEGKSENLATTVDYPDSPLNVTAIPEVTLTNATSLLKVVVTDVVNKTTEMKIVTFVNMQFVAEAAFGSHPLANGYINTPDIYALFSLKDMKSYSVSYALENAENAANVDLKFYVFGGKAVLRMYSIDGGTGTKSNEFKGADGKSVMDMEVQNSTKLLKLSGFDFENATAQSIIDDIPASNITSNQVNPFLVGDVIAFKTADTSTSGGGRIGIMKILSDEQVNPSNVTARVIKVAIKFPK